MRNAPTRLQHNGVKCERIRILVFWSISIRQRIKMPDRKTKQCISIGYTSSHLKNITYITHGPWKKTNKNSITRRPLLCGENSCNCGVEYRIYGLLSILRQHSACCSTCTTPGISPFTLEILYFATPAPAFFHVRTNRGRHHAWRWSSRTCSWRLWRSRSGF